MQLPKKINAAVAKEFLFLHGEKIALGVCAFLALSFGLVSMVRALSAGADKSGTPYPVAIKKKHDAIHNGIRSASAEKLPADTEAKLKEEFYLWKFWESKFGSSLYLWVRDAANDKRDNPRALTIMSGPKNIQFDYVRSLVLAYEYDTAARTMKGLVPDTNTGDKGPGPAGGPMKKGAKGKDNGPPPTFLHAGQPTRMLVCTAKFPMRQQVEEFKRKLRMKSQADLLASKTDLPKPMGIQVIRYEVLPNKGIGQKVDLIKFELRDGKVQTQLAEPLKRLLRDSLYDDYVPHQLEPYIFEGCMTPTPKLAYGSYPNLQLEGIDVDLTVADEGTVKKDGPMGPKKGAGGGPQLPGGRKGPKMPMQPNQPGGKNGNQAELKPVSITLKELKAGEPTLADRLFAGEFNALHALGLYEQVQSVVSQPAAQPVGQPAKQKGMGEGQGGASGFFAPWSVPLPDKGDKEDNEKPMGKGPMVKGGPMPQAGQIAEWDRDTIIRFVDPDVEPGKTYRYAIQVRFWNPNFNKKDEVMFQQLATLEELPIDPIDSWVLTQDYTIPYEYSLYAVDQILLDDWANDRKPNPQLDARKDHTFFQVQQWVKRKSTFAEDDVIGDWVVAERLHVRKGDHIGEDAIVQVPVWKKFKDAFEIPNGYAIKLPKGNTILRPGLKITLPVSNDNNSTAVLPVLVDFVGGKYKMGNASEDVAVDALVMGSDGRLFVINSREHSDPDNAVARERAERLRHARKRVEDLTAQPEEGMK